MYKNRMGALGATGVLAAAAVLGGPGIASAQKDQGPVQFNAEGNDQCEVTFTIENRTNSEFYTIDYMIDDEFTYWEADMHYSVTRFALDSSAESPTIPDKTAVYDDEREPVTSQLTIDLREVENLPNQEADEHTISYRMIRGPQTADRDDDNVYTTQVTGCESDPVGDFIGSIVGSVDVFGSLGSVSS